MSSELPKELELNLREYISNQKKIWAFCSHEECIIRHFKEKAIKVGNMRIFHVELIWRMNYCYLDYISLDESDIEPNRDSIYRILNAGAVKYCDKCRRLCGMVRRYLLKNIRGWSNLSRDYIRDISMVSRQNNEDVFIRLLHKGVYETLVFGSTKATLTDSEKSRLWYDFVRYVRFIGKRAGLRRAADRTFADVSLSFL